MSGYDLALLVRPLVATRHHHFHDFGNDTDL